MVITITGAASSLVENDNSDGEHAVRRGEEGGFYDVGPGFPSNLSVDFPRWSRQGSLPPTPENICPTLQIYPYMVRFWVSMYFAANDPNLTLSAKQC